MSLGEAPTPAPSRHARSAPVLPVEIDLRQTGFVNYALANSGISPVRRLTITNTDEEPLTDVAVRVAVLDSRGEALATPWSRTFAEVAPGTPVHVESVGLRPDPSALLDVEERRLGTIVVEVDDGRREGRLEQSVEVLAHHQWHHSGHSAALSIELLAAFVQPNHPAVAPLLTEAREILRSQTGSSSTEGYQAGSDRADEIAEAICRALQARQVAYSNPPASWDGQKIHTPAQVLEINRAGACLDTTVLLAAAFEQAGLHPILWLFSNHILVGWWRDEDRRLPQIVSQEQGALLNHLDLDHLAVVETTMLTARSEPVSIDDARSDAARTGRGAPPLGVIDVRGARRAGIGPLPALHRDPQGVLVVTVQAPSTSGPSSGPVAPAPPVDQRRRTTGPEVPARIRRWKNALPTSASATS